MYTECHVVVLLLDLQLGEYRPIIRNDLQRVLSCMCPRLSSRCPGGQSVCIRSDRLCVRTRDGWRLQPLSIQETRDQLKFRRTAELLLCLAKLSNNEYTFRSQVRATSTDGRRKNESLSAERLRRVLEESSDIWYR